MRDRLIELLIKGNNQPCGNGSLPWEDNYCKGCEYENKKDCRVLQLADYLIANGVVVFSTHLKNIEPPKYKIYDKGEWGKSVSLIDGHIDE